MHVEVVILAGEIHEFLALDHGSIARAQHMYVWCAVNRTKMFHVKHFGSIA
jgi:hypothetical protein